MICMNIRVRFAWRMNYLLIHVQYEINPAEDWMKIFITSDVCANIGRITDLVIGFGSRMTWGENLVVDYREMIVPHKQLIRCVIPVVTVRKIAVALLVDVAVAWYKQISPGTKDRSYAATDDVKFELSCRIAVIFCKKSRRSLLRMVADREWFFHDVEFRRRYVLIVGQREEETLLRSDVLRLRVSFTPRNVAESPAYLAAHSLRHNKTRILQLVKGPGWKFCTHQHYHVRRANVVAVPMERRRWVAMSGRSRCNGLWNVCVRYYFLGVTWFILRFSIVIFFYKYQHFIPQFLQLSIFKMLFDNLVRSCIWSAEGEVGSRNVRKMEMNLLSLLIALSSRVSFPQTLPAWYTFKTYR